MTKYSDWLNTTTSASQKSDSFLAQDFKHIFRLDCDFWIENYKVERELFLRQSELSEPLLICASFTIYLRRWPQRKHISPCNINQAYMLSHGCHVSSW